MATVEQPPRRVRNVAEASRRVLDPLQRLRGYIRLYVSLEATAIVLLFLAASFWASLAFDYGAFKLPGSLSIDWVQQLPWVLRLLVVVGFVLFLFAIIAAKAINRLIQRFRDAALALELERRFPKILGDRLITAVELSNRGKVLEQGYSQAMVDETIMEAAERVEKLPLKEVFRWRRLWALYGLVACLTVGMYFVVLAGFCTVDYFQTGRVSLAGAGDFHEAAGIWFERNILLWDTIWPRRSYIQFLEPADANIRQGRDEPPPSLRLRAYEYVKALPGTRDGWRGLQWSDLEANHKIAGDPAEPVDGWAVRDPNAGLTVDEVALFFGKFDVRKGAPAGDEFVSHGYRSKAQWTIADPTEENPKGRRPLSFEKDLTSDYLGGMTVPTLPASSKQWNGPLEPDKGFSVDEVARESAARPDDPELADVRVALAHLERLAAMRDTLDKLDDRIADNSMRRTVRKVVVPQAVTVTVKGPTTNSTTTLTRLANNEYTGQFGELKEKTTEAWPFYYYARGEDFTTADRYLTLVPPPALAKLYREERRPAYLFYRPGAGRGEKPLAAELRGQKQLMPRAEVSLTGGDLVRIDVPAGTDLTLFAEADKDLAGVELTEPKNGPPLQNVQLQLDGRNFTVTFAGKYVREDLSFEVRMTDKDHARGVRRFQLRVQKDVEPQVDLSIAEWVRKTKDGYLVTAKARIPFTGKIEDDHGLSRVQYVYNVAKVESSALTDLKALESAGAVPMAAIPGAGALHGATFLTRGLQLFDQVKGPRGDREDVRYYYPDRDGSILSFHRALNDPRARPDEFLPADEIARRLADPARGERQLFRLFELVPDKGELVVTDTNPFGTLADFPLEAADLLPKGGQAQGRYRVTLWVEAADTDLDSTKAADGVDGPKIGISKERYTFMVVAEVDLMSEIAKDEEKLGLDLSVALDDLREVLDKLTSINTKLAGNPEPEEFAQLPIRAEALEQKLDQAHAKTKEVLAKYESLLLEMRGNRIDPQRIEAVDKQIIRPLKDSIDAVEFPDAKAKMQEFRKQLDGKDVPLATVVARSRPAGNDAREQVNTLVEAMKAVLDKMQSEIDLKKIVEKLRNEQRDLERQKDLIEAIKRQKEREILEGIDPKNP